MSLPMLSVDRRQALAAQVCVRDQYLYQILRGLGVASPALARKLHRFEPTLRLQDLRPDDWREIWPELADSEEKQPPALTNQAQAATETVAQGAAHA